jgi:hypothetical protein
MTPAPSEPTPRPKNRRPSAAYVEQRRQEDKSLDLVQRGVMSALLGVVFGSLASVLDLYLAIRGPQDLVRTAVVGLWIMSGLFGLATAGAILAINRRRFYSPWILIGLLPMAASAYWIL